MSLNKKISWSFIILAFLMITLTNPQMASASVEDEVVIYLFWGEGCPYCEIAKTALEDLAESNPHVKFEDYEINHNPENLQLFSDLASKFGFEPAVFPTIFVGDQYWEGYSEEIRADIETHINQFLEPSSANPGENRNANGITLPLIGTIDLSGQSLLVSTLIISFVDGFNPCSLWVLSILLSITLQSHSRKKVLIVGGTFLVVTATLYGLFIAGVFSVLRIFKFMGWIQVVVALIALGFALVNIKDYFWFQQGVSFTISDDKKPGIYKRMRKVLEHSDSIWRLMGATIVFAAGIALVELSCTAGFPVIWSNLLASQHVNALTFVLLLLVYMLVYLLDEMAIFLVAVFTLRSTKLEEKHGRVLKLIGGVLMLTLSGVMLVDPTLMNDITTTLIIFGIALILTALILLVHRVILPKFIIFIGSEK